MKIGVANQNIVAKIYCRCLSTFLVLDLLLMKFVHVWKRKVKVMNSLVRAFKMHMKCGFNDIYKIKQI